MKKFKSLLLAAIMVVGLSAISANTLNAACVPYSISCENGISVEGIVCGSSTAVMIESVLDVADYYC